MTSFLKLRLCATLIPRLLPRHSGCDQPASIHPVSPVGRIHAYSDVPGGCDRTEHLCFRPSTACQQIKYKIQISNSDAQRCLVVNPNVPHVHGDIMLVRQSVRHFAHTRMFRQDPRSHLVKARLQILITSQLNIHNRKTPRHGRNLKNTPVRRLNCRLT